MIDAVAEVYKTRVMVQMEEEKRKRESEVRASDQDIHSLTHSLTASFVQETLHCQLVANYVNAL